VIQHPPWPALLGFLTQGNPVPLVVREPIKTGSIASHRLGYLGIGPVGMLLK
jgi:hypothetical protein